MGPKLGSYEARTQKMKPRHLFVYGTLRPGLSDKQAAKNLLSNATHVGPATFPGKLLLIDWYPGAVDSDHTAHRIVGDLFDVGDSSKLLKELDAYEGCAASDPQPHEYCRVVRDVECNGRTVSAWIYLYAWPLAGCTVIESGDFSPN